MTHSQLETLWLRHYHPGVTGSYHGDMAFAFDSMSKDKDCECDLETATKLRHAAKIFTNLERIPSHNGRKWFCELFGILDCVAEKENS